MNTIARYFSDLADGVGAAWNRFWYNSADPLPLAVLRVGLGLITLYYLGSFTADLIRWFGPHGLLPIDVVRQLTGGGAMTSQPQEAAYRFSLLYLGDSPGLVWTIHLAGLTAAALLTVGFWTRLSNLVTLLIVLSYVHRAPMITGQLEPVLCMSLFYLCLGPSNAWLSLDRRLASRDARDAIGRPCLSANIALRLLQVHVAAFYLTMGLEKLGGNVWWAGEAVWLLIARTESRLVDLSFLHNATYLLNLWTHAIVLFELAFALFVWNRRARPLLIGLSVLMWGGVAMLTGLLGFCALMVVVGVAFIPGQWLRSWLTRRGAASEPAPA